MAWPAPYGGIRLPARFDLSGLDGTADERQRQLATHRREAGHRGATLRAVAEVPSSLSIREVSQLSGYSAAALRYYEEEGLIAALPRSETASRHYDVKVLNTLSVIQALRSVGFGISDIRDLLSIKKGGETRAQRLKRAEGALQVLKVKLQERRNALERAEALLAQWSQDVSEAAASYRK